MAMELRLEVLHAQQLSSADYRFGDLNCSFLGSDLRPFVEVTCQSQKQLSHPVHARGGTAIFGWNTCFDLEEGDPNCLFRVYDKKGAQTALWGDPLIGEAVLPLVKQISPKGLVATFTLRNGRASTGQLTVIYEVRQFDAQEPLCPRGVALLGTAFGDVICPGACLEGAPQCCQPFATDSCTATASVEAAGASNALRDHGSSSRSSSSSSCGSFRSALEEPENSSECLDGDAVGERREGVVSAKPVLSERSSSATASVPDRAAQHREDCEQIADRYATARIDNDIATLRGLCADDVILTLPKPLGGYLKVASWPKVEAHFLKYPAKAEEFRAWGRVQTQDPRAHGPPKGPETTVRLSGQIYKLGCWLQMKVDISVDSQLLIKKIDVGKA
jgi:hypothetical protein